MYGIHVLSERVCIDEDLIFYFHVLDDLVRLNIVSLVTSDSWLYLEHII